jgi:hypothetical protein
MVVVAVVVILVCSCVGDVVQVPVGLLSYSVILPLSLPELTENTPHQSTCTPAQYFSFNIILILIPTLAIIVYYLH